VKRGCPRLFEGAGFLALAMAVLLASCSSDDDEIVSSSPGVKKDAGSDTSSFGGSGGTGFGGTEPGGASGSGASGSGGNGGSSGAGSGGAAGIGTCTPEFCPSDGVGVPCCVVPGRGPCGYDNGMGCQGVTPNDF
jgi:hypothetical protein